MNTPDTIDTFLDDTMLRAIAKWEKQGRSEDEKWAVRNFETGTLIKKLQSMTIPKQGDVTK
jgi:hypothetical protein